MEQSLTSSRNFTCPKQLHAADNSEKFSLLPDTVLSHILSLVPTKDATRTSILSKRWKEVWLSISNYTFDEDSHVDRKLFMKLLNRVLHRDMVIDELSISCGALNDENLLHSMFSSVKELNLILNSPFVFPSSADIPNSLVTLKLNLSYNGLNLPSDLKLSRLKILHFECLMFPSDSSIEHLFSNCCILEQLVIAKCKWKTDCIISAPKLRSLVIHEELKEYFTVSKNIITIIGSELGFFEYKGGLVNDYSLVEPWSLDAADIDVGDLPRLFDNDRIVALRAFALLSKLKNVTCLRITSDTAGVISNYERECRMQWPDFKNLIELEITESPMDLTYDSLLSILSKAQSLQSLTFSEGIYISDYEDCEDWEWNSIPRCFSSHLRNIHVGAFCGYPFEVSAVEFLLQHAVVLEKMVISFAPDKLTDLLDKFVMRKKLQTLPRGSVSCRIDFS